MQVFIKQAHPEWHDVLSKALTLMDNNYLEDLLMNDNWLPGNQHIFAAFNLPLNSLRYLLLGESPYPRAASANGYAFWDNAVQGLWSSTGLSTEVNRATSLRNLIKMLLYARSDLTTDLSQQAIANLCKDNYVQSAKDLFKSMLDRGFLLLNASLVYSEDKVVYHAKKWQPFMHSLLLQLAEIKPDLHLIVLGKIAKQIPEQPFVNALVAEHPYNLSFIKNPKVVEFFKPLDLLVHYDKYQHG